MKIVISISIDKNILEKIDKERGDIPRATFINKILKTKMKGGEKK